MLINQSIIIAYDDTKRKGNVTKHVVDYKTLTNLFKQKKSKIIERIDITLEE
jgi:uncharacterized DUF497 family protein